MDFETSEEYRELATLVSAIQSKYGINASDIFSRLTEQDFIPTSVFSKTLSPLETVVKFLHENSHHSFVEISKLLNRSQKTIWQAYDNSKKKTKEQLTSTGAAYFIPVTIFSDRTFSVFEHIITYLVDHEKLRYCDVGRALERDSRTIWTVYHRAKKKLSHGR